MSLTFQPVIVDVGEEAEGRLVFDGGRLVAVLARLSRLHGDEAGAWFLEIGFGCLDTPTPPIFPDLAAAGRWVEARLTARPRIARRGAGS